MKLTALIILTVYGIYSVAQECGCPNEWTYFAGSCYYLADELKAEWWEAKDYCKSKDANLVRIESATEDQFLQSYCKKIFRRDVVEDDSAWTGASDNDTEGVWEWLSGDPEMIYINWDEGQPDSRMGRDQDCMSLYSLSGFTWHDSGCEAKFHPICEIALVEPE